MRELASLRSLALGIRVGGCQHRTTPLAENRVSAEREERGVDAAGVRDEHALERLEAFEERVVLLGRRHV